MEPLPNARLIITGIVQGVGFRPFLFNLARNRKSREEFLIVEIWGSYRDFELLKQISSLKYLSKALGTLPP